MKRAHTIVELIFVMVLMGAAFLTVFVTVSSTSVQTLDTAVRRISADIMYAQSMAMNSGRWCGIRFNADQNYYYVYRYDPGVGETILKNPLNPGKELKIYLGVEYNRINIAQVECNMDLLQDYILFKSDGTPCDLTGTVYALDSKITVSSAGQMPYYRYIRVAPQTGKVSVADS